MTIQNKVDLSSTNYTDDNFSCFLVINFDETPARSVNPYDIDAIQELNVEPPASVVGNDKTGCTIKCLHLLYKPTKVIH